MKKIKRNRKKSFKSNSSSVWVSLGLGVILAGGGTAIAILAFHYNEDRKEGDNTLKNTNQHLVNNFEDIKDTDLPNLPKSDSKILPTRVEKPKGGLIKLGIMYEFTKWVQNNETGDISWVAELVSSDGKTKIISGTIGGFQRLIQFEDENSLINAIKGFDDTRKVNVGDQVQIKDQEVHIVNQEFFNTEKDKNSYKGHFSAKEIEEEFMECVDKVGFQQFINESDITFLSMPLVTVIEQEGFDAAPLTSLDLPKIRKVSGSAFSQAQLTRLDLPEVEWIGYGAFWESKLTYLNLPKVKRIGVVGDPPYGPFRAIVNEETTKVIIPQVDDQDSGVSFDSIEYKDYLFAKDNWDKISFTWLTTQE